MRILYVAMTRARERLVLIAAEKLKNCAKTISNGYYFGDGPVPDWQLKSAQSPLRWILYALSDRDILHNAFQTGLAECEKDDDLFSFNLYDQSELKQLARFVLKLKTDRLIRSSTRSKKARTKRKESKLFKQIKKSLEWQYPFSDIYSLPAKNSVTQLTHHNDEYVTGFWRTHSLDRMPGVLMSSEHGLTKPLEPRVLGSATHLVISQLDLSGIVTKETIETAKDKLPADNAITSYVADNIDAESILSFFHSAPGKLVLDPENTIYREWPFTFALPASEFTDSSDKSQTTGDEIIVQGIIDMLIRTTKGLVVIDFKTDRITAAQVTERAGLYRRQLELYGRAASAILNSKCIAKRLYFLTPRISKEV